MTERRTLIDGKPATHVSVEDRGLLYGDGLFETLRVYEGRPFALEEHLARLIAGLSTLEIDTSGLASALQKDLEALALSGSQRLRITVTAGIGEGMLRPKGMRPTRIVSVSPFTPGTPTRIVALADEIPCVSPLRLKSTSYALANELARRAARVNAFEGIAIDTGGFVLEGARSNVFFVFENELATPPLDELILPGVTRALVLALARESGIFVNERRIHESEIRSAKGAFLTSSLLEIAAIDEWIATDGARVTFAEDRALVSRLRAAYQARIRPSDP